MQSIPDEEILQSQFPNVLKELQENEARRDELESVFKEVNELEEGVWSEEDYEVFTKDALSEVKNLIKRLGGEFKELDRDIKNKEKQIKALKSAGEPYKTVVVEIALLISKSQELIDRVAVEENRISKHIEMEAELKVCRKKIKEIKDRKDILVEEARERIYEAEAKNLILARWERTLYSTVEEYLDQFSRNFRSSLENLWEKYHQPLHVILNERDEASAELAGYLKELGYE